MQVRMSLRHDGKVDMVFKPTRPGEQRTIVVPAVRVEEVKDAAELAVAHMRAQTKFAA